MRTLTLALILISIGVNAQYSNSYEKKINNPNSITTLNSPRLYLPAITITCGVSSAFLIPNLTQEQQATIVMSSVIVSGIEYIVFSNPKYRKGYLKHKFRFGR